MINTISTSGTNLADLIYLQTEEGKYKFFGLRLYKTHDEEGAIVAEIENLDDLIDNLDALRKKLKEFNSMGS